MSSQMSAYEIDFRRNKLNTRFRNEVIAGNIKNIYSLVDELVRLGVNVHQPNIGSIVSHNKMIPYPDRNNIMWMIFDSVTAEHLSIVEDLLPDDSTKLLRSHF